MGRRSKQITDKSIMWNVALYIRLSREDGNDISLSVEHQREILENYYQNSEENFSLFDIYIDDGKTGTDSDRPNFQRMLSDIKSKKVNCVIVKDTSRLSRNYAEAGLYMEQYFVENNVRFISLSLPSLDSYLRPDEISSIATAMQNVINDDFCRQTSLKIRGVFNIKRSKGQFIGAFAPYGYLKDPSNKYKLIKDEISSQVVKDIFHWFTDGYSKSKIVRKLTDLGTLTPTDYKNKIGLNYKNPHNTFKVTYWSTKTISEILKNQMYIGDMVQGRGKVVSYKIHKHVKTDPNEWYIVEGTHEPIVSKETFYKAQELLKRDIKPSTKGNNPYLFSGLMRCGDCKHSMHRNKKDNYVYYCCKTYKSYGKGTCTRHSIREDELESAVLQATNNQLLLIENIENLINEIIETPTTKKFILKIEKAINNKDMEIIKINKIRDSLYTDWKTGDITRDDYLRLKNSYDLQLEELKKSLHSLKNELITYNDGLDTNNQFFNYYRQYKKMDILERSLLLELVDCIYIYENKQIIINFKFADQQKRLVSLLEANKEKTLLKNFVL